MKDSSSLSPPHQSSMASTLAAMGLFVATAAISQWIQLHHASKESSQTPPRSHHKHRRRRRRRLGSRSTSCDEDWFSCNTSVDEDSNLIMSKEAFRRRRLARRMSFEQVDADEQQQQQSRRNSLSKSIDGEAHSRRGHRSGQQSPAVAKAEPVTEWSLHCAIGDLVSPQGRCLQASTQQQQQQKQRVPEEVSGQHQTGRSKTAKHPRLDRELTTPHTNQSAPNYRYHDFHPKYQNWRHFEHFNDHERKQKRKVQLSRIRHETIQQQQNQQPPPLQQEAGEGASQRDVDEQRIQSAAQESGGHEPIIHHDQQKQSEIDNASDNDSLSTIDNERESDNENRQSLSDSVTSFGSDNQYSWTGANTNLEIDGAFRTRQQKRGKDPFGPPLPNKSLNMNRLAIRSGTAGARDNAEGTSSGSSSKKNKMKKSANHRMGKFERFYRMLTESFIEDDSNHVGGESTNRISISSESTNFGSSSNSTSFDYDGDVEDRHRALRTEYNAQIMPEKLVLIRHGQSMGNVDETYYAKISDNAMPLTDLGWEQARNAGTILKDKIITPGESVHFIVSPYVRTVETFHGIVSAWCDPESEEFATIKDRNRKVNAWYERLTELGLTWNEDSRIREQDFGNYQNPEQTRKAKEERHRFGAFYYRFHNGESGSDVYDRVSTFLDSLWRSFETNKSQNYVLVTHGIVLRVLMARYFRYTITQLNTLANPRNCEMVVLGHEGNGRLDLEGRCMLELEEDPETKKKSVKGYKFHKRLRVLPKSNIRKVRFRISAKDQTSI